jgi:hypothetical protein
MSIINSLWVAGDLSNLEILAIKSFLVNSHEYHLYSYDPPKNAPRGTKVCDGRKLLPEESIFTYNQGRGKGSVSAFSNVFRYTLLHEKGGYWVDTDVVCLRPFDFTEEVVLGLQRSRYEDFKVASCVIKSPAGHEFTKYCLDVCQKTDLVNLQWGQIGPTLVTNAIEHLGLKRSVQPAETFCPSDWWKVDQEMVGSLGERVNLENSYAVHLWHEMWRRNQFDKNKNQHPTSLYNLLRARYTI